MAYAGNLVRFNKNVVQTIPSAGGSDASGKVQIGNTWDFANLHRKTFYVYSWGASVITTAILEYSPDGVKWGTYNATTFQNLGSDVLKVYTVEDSVRFIKFSAGVGSVTSTVAVWVTF